MSGVAVPRPLDVGSVLDDYGIDALLIGFPKCGTTALAQWLAASSGVAMSNPKETFLLVPEFGRTAAIGRNGPFAGTGEGVRVEATTLNIYSPRLRAAVANRTTKVVVAIRPAAESLPSWHNQMEKAGLAAGDGIEDLLAHTGTQPDRPEYLRDYRQMSAYGLHLQAWLDAVGHERLLVVETSEMEGDSSALAGRLGSFLGVEPPTGEVPQANVYEELRMGSAYRRVVRGSFGRRLQRSLRRWPSADRVAARLRRALLGRRPEHRPLPTPGLPDDALASELIARNREYWAGRS